MGYAAACLLPRARELAERSKLAFAVLEPAYCVGLAVVVVVGNGVLPRSVYTALFVGLVLLLALEAGPVARLLGAAPLLAAGRYELDFYIFHQPCIKLVGYLIGGLGRKALAAFVLTCTLVWLWRNLDNLVSRR